MKMFRTMRRRRAAVLLPLVPMLTFQVLPVFTFAQQTPQNPAPTDRTDRNKERERENNPAERENKKTPLAPPANPLVIVDPTTGTGNNPKAFDKRGNRVPERFQRPPNFGNYVDNPRDPRDESAEKRRKKDELPYFGYDAFEPTRQFILARRAYYQSLYAVDTTKRKPATGTSRNYGPVYREGRDSMASPQSRNGQPEAQSRPRLDKDGNPISDAPRSAKQGEIIAPAFGEKRTERRRTQDDRDETGVTPQLLRRNTNDPETDDQEREPYYDDYGNLIEDDGYEYPVDAEEIAQDQEARRRRSLRDDQLNSFYFNDRQARPDEANMDEDDPLNSRRLTTRERMQQDAARRAALQREMTQGAIGSAPTMRPRSSVEASPLNAFTNIADPLSQIFRNIAASAPTSYQLAPNDKLTIRYSTPAMAAREYNVTVNMQGAIDLEGMGSITVRGMTSEQAQNAITARLKRLYKNPSVTVTLRDLRTMTVYASGDVFEPGSYTLPSVATAYTLLQAAGGPTYDGSLRRIEVRRGGVLAGTLDLYEMRRNRTKKDGSTYDIRLQDGDTVYVPPRESTVTLTGEVRTPAIYELKEGESLGDLLTYAGNIKPSGVAQNVQVNTVEPGRARVLKNVDIKKPGESARFALYDGDSVDVFSVRQTVVNKVTIEGAVESPGDYAMTEGMTIAELVETARGVLSETSLNQAELYRWNPDNTTTLITIDLNKAIAKDPKENMELKRWDRLKLYTRQEIAFTGFRKVEVRGAVQYPGIYERSQNMRVADILRQVGGPTPDAFLDNAVLMHQYGDGRTKYEEINIAEAMKNNPTHNIAIEDNDLLSVYKVGEAKFVPDQIVHIKGFVNAPGIYKRGEGMKLSQLIRIAGGFTPKAGSEVTLAHARRVLDGPNADFSKKVTVVFDSQGRCAPNDDLVLEDGDVVTIQGTGGFIDKVPTITVKGAVNKPGPIVINSKNMRLSDAIKEAGGMRSEAFPEGAAFYRDPELLTSPGQEDLVKVISELNNLLNESAYRRELAKSDINRAQALSQVSQESTLAIPGVTGGQPSGGGAGVFATELSKRETVTRPRVFTDRELAPNGVIAINLPDALKKPLGDADIQLMDGDTIVVPEKPTTVQVRGAVVNQRGVLFRERESLEYYLSQAGGLAPDAEKKGIVIIRANGGTLPVNKVRDLRPGDLILVPNRVLAERIAAKQNVFDSLFRSLTSTALVFRLFGL
jgi:protein involved in polysaccharide export with SLBB domain